MHFASSKEPLMAKLERRIRISNKNVTQVKYNLHENNFIPITLLQSFK